MSDADTPINRSGLTFTDRVVIVTGGSRGIGAGCARVFVEAGAKVMICGRDPEAGQSLVKELGNRTPGQCAFQACDVSQPEEIRTLIDATVSQFGRLDCLINNAGYHPPVKRIDDFDLADLQDVWQTNFVSQFVACRHALPHLRKTRGSIINMSSLVGDIGQEGATIYCSTKGAINAFTKALAIEEATNGVRVNAVLPGNIVSDSRVQFLRTAPNAEEIDRWIDANQHNGRSGTNEEVGQLCLFLASAAASYITGTLQIISAGAELGYGVKYPTTFL